MQQQRLKRRQHADNQPGLRHGCWVHVVWLADVEVVEAVKKIFAFVSMPQTLGLCCVLTLLTNADLKADITLFLSSTDNPLSSFHTLDTLIL